MIDTKFYGHTAMVRDMASNFHIRLWEAEEYLNFLYGKIQEHLMDNDIVRIKHLCSIKLSRCPEREMYNYSADKNIRIPSRRRIRIAPAKRLEDILKGETR